MLQTNDDMDDLLNMIFYGKSDIKQGSIGEPVPAPTEVYRIEMPTGFGPFNSGLPNASKIYEDLTRPDEGWPGHLLLNNTSMHKEQMGVTEAAFRRKHGHACYGCIDLPSLNLWFPPPARQYLDKLDGKIVQYCLPTGAYLLKLIESAGEIVFSKEQAKLITRLDICMEIKS